MPKLAAHGVDGVTIEEIELISEEDMVKFLEDNPEFDHSDFEVDDATNRYIVAINKLKKDEADGKGLYIPTKADIALTAEGCRKKSYSTNAVHMVAPIPVTGRGSVSCEMAHIQDYRKICYQCENRVVYLFDDGRCADCTRLTTDEVRGVAISSSYTEDDVDDTEPQPFCPECKDSKSFLNVRLTYIPSMNIRKCLHCGYTEEYYG